MSPEAHTPHPAFANLQQSSLDQLAIFQQELDENFEGFERQAVEEALLLMCKVHGGQSPRAEGRPFVEHPLEVARNILHSQVQPDSESVIAALLHDSVEDQAAKLAAKLEDPQAPGDEDETARAFAYIESRFGSRVRRMVSRLTNPDFETELLAGGREVTPDSKNELYVAHVAEVIQDEEVLPIKLFDLAKNTLRLDAVANQVRKLQFVRKYMPGVSLVIQRLQSGSIPNFKEEIRLQLLGQFEQTYAKMQVDLAAARQA